MPKIKDITAEVVPLVLKAPFKVAFGEITALDSVFLRLTTDTGLTGLGECAPLPFVTGDFASVLPSVLALIKSRLVGLETDPQTVADALDNIAVHNTALKAGIDLAVHDVAAQAKKESLAQFLGYRGAAPLTAWTDITLSIASEKDMVAEALAKQADGFRFLKVKVGQDVSEDVRKLKALRAHLGEDFVLRVDANQGFSFEEAVSFCRRIADLNITFLEQPLHHKDILGLAALRAQTPQKIMADESLFSPEDARLLIALEAVDALNIKLMKCGGLWRARQIADIAQAAGLPCMIGCMLESRIGITAAAALALTHPNISMIDLDSPLFIKDMPTEGGVQYDKDGRITLTGTLGLGVSAK